MVQPGHPKEILKGGTRLPWGPGNGVRLLSKFKIQKKREKFKLKRLWLRLWGSSEIHKPILALRAPDRSTG